MDLANSVGETEASQPKAVYVCSICGYEFPGSKEEFEKLPEDYICPMCGVPKDKFVLK